MANAEEKRQWASEGKCYSCGKKLPEGYTLHNCKKCLKRYSQYSEKKSMIKATVKKTLEGNKPKGRPPGAKNKVAKRKYTKSKNYTEDKVDVAVQNQNSVLIVNIPLEFERDGNKLICDSTDKLKQIMGTTSVIGNYHMFGITKQDKKFVIPMSALKDRKKELTERLAKIQLAVALLEQVC